MLTRVLIGAVRFYQRAVSPFTPSACRFTPTCSEYARRSLETHGALSGGWLALRRVLRCHPWGRYGYDPVPDPTDSRPEPAAGPSPRQPIIDGTPLGPVTSDRT